MTASPIVNVCAVCGEKRLVAMSSGTVFCPMCGAEYDPADPPQTDNPIEPDVGTPHASTADPTTTTFGDQLDQLADEVVNTDRDPEVSAVELAQSMLDALVGTRVVLDGGQVATIVEFSDDDHAVVRLNDGRTETVELGDIERSIVEPAAVAPDIEVEVTDEQAAQLASTFMAIGGLAINAALASIVEVDGQQVVVMSPTGWIPDDRKIIPLIELGVGQAIATIVYAFHLPIDAVQSIASTFIDSAQVGQTEGESNDDGQAASIEPSDAGRVSSVDDSSDPERAVGPDHE